MNVEIFMHNTNLFSTGIGRYTLEVFNHLNSLISVCLRYGIDPPLTRLFSPLHHLPLGLRDHKPGSIVHFTQIMGCAMMLWDPIHPSVVTVHDLGMLVYPEEWKMMDPIARQLLRLSLNGLKRADLIIAVSEFTKQSIIRNLDISPNHVITIHSGINRDYFFPMPDAKERLLNNFPYLSSLSGPRLLYVGSELPRKNLSVLLEATAILKKEFPNITLLKIGSAGGKRFRDQFLKNIQIVNLNDFITFIEGITDQELGLFYSAADVFVQPSNLEGFGFPVLEAMACGIPVVCSRAGSLPEIVEHAGILVDPKDASAFAHAIATIFRDNELRENLISQGIWRSHQFTWERTVEKTISCYHQL